MSFKEIVGGDILLKGLNTLLLGFVSAYFILLERNYCFSADDFAGLDYASKGIPGLTLAWHFYFNWEGPFLNNVVHGILMRLVSMGFDPWIVLLFIKFAVLVSISMVFAAVGQRLNWKLSKSQILYSGVVFMVTLYLISPQPTQIWHWLTGMLYLYPLVFFCLGVAALVNEKFLLAVAPLAVVMQSRVTYAVILLGFFALICIITYCKKEANRKKWLFLTLILLFFLVVYVVAPGNYVRLSEHGMSIGFMINQFISGLQNLIVSYNVAKMDRAVLGVGLILMALNPTRKSITPAHKMPYFIPGAAYLAFVLAHGFVFVGLTGYHEWDRVFSLHSFLFLGSCTVYGFWVFGLIPITIVKLRKLGLVLGTIGMLAYLFWNFSQDYSASQEMRVAYQARHSAILQHQGKADTLYIEAVNYPGPLYFKDFSQDPDNWINKDFAKAYGLNFKLAVKE